MQDECSIPQFDTLQKPESQEETIEIEETPSIEEIITAPENDWRRLCALAEADPAMMLALRARRQLKESGQLKPAPRRRASPRSRPSTSNRNWRAGSVLQSQALIGAAMLETVERVNRGELDGDGELRSILVTAGDQTLVMEVIA